MRVNRFDAAALDAVDPMAFVRERFVIPEGLVYLDGNSLGMLPKGVAERVEDVIRRQWGNDLIRSWNTHGWMDAPRRVGDRIASLIGAQAGEVIVADSTSVNIYKLLMAACRMRPGRSVIVTEEGNFPSDRYLIASVAEGLGLTVRVAKTGHIADALQDLDDRVAVASFSHADYRTGALHDIKAVTSACHAVGALTMWDLAHTAGVLDLSLTDANVDFAVGCGYKFLNGGPGAPSFLYVAERHQAMFEQPLTGWLGHAKPFAMSEVYEPSAGIGRAVVGTPSMLSLVALEAALDVFDGVSMAAVRAKSIALTDFMIDCAADQNLGLSVATPLVARERSSHVSFRHLNGFEIVQALFARGVVGDFREPDIMRLGLSPLYTRFVDVWDAVSHLGDVLRTESWRDPAYSIRGTVT